MFRARKKQGFRVRMLDERDVQQLFGFSAPRRYSLRSRRGLPPLQADQLADEQDRAQGRYRSRSDGDRKLVGGKEPRRPPNQRGSPDHGEVRGRGRRFESQDYLAKNVSRFHSTYAIVSKPVSTRSLWHRNSRLWETKSPYLYARTTADGRILVGGRDESFQSAGKRDALIGRKSRELRADFGKLFPRIPFEIDFAWAGTFGETKDGLPYIGNPQEKRVFFAMGYGGNGITFSVVAANLIADAILKRKNPDAPIFSFDR